MTTRVKLLAVLLGLALLGFLGMQLAHAVSGSGTQSVGPAVTVTAPSSPSAGGTSATGAGSTASASAPTERPPLNNAQRATLRSLLVDVAENAHLFTGDASNSTTTPPAGTAPSPANVAPAPAPVPAPAAPAPAPQRVAPAPARPAPPQYSDNDWDDDDADDDDWDDNDDDDWDDEDDD
ncbi:hypothetical protein [Actinotignum sp. GS-2025b]|uniref:hypothetical protein n=1 Tax=Actinotignum sp. GS-2025b TaxID=3427275 RepID=UPI003F46AD3C